MERHLHRHRHFVRLRLDGLILYFDPAPARTGGTERRKNHAANTGTARGRRLKELEGTETRPTTDRVKEGLFSALQFDIEGRRVLDLFAGTGQLGIECLSRGAASAVFVDRRADAVKLIRRPKLTELQDRARVVAGDSMEFLRSLRERFDIVFLDFSL